ncbi:ankyrin repeat-containing domain protein [Mycena latifolia]|nr:ankyrin repeat-containing domain protein [Mycena latifolia]
MAEIMGLVGLVASVLQLVDAMAGAHRYIMNFRDAPKDQKRLLSEIQSLEPLVKELGNRIKSNQAAGLTSGLQKFETPLIQLKRVMERLTQKLDSSGISKVSNRVVWPLWGKEDIEEGLNTIERFKSLLNTWLGMDIWSDFAEEQRTDHSYIASSIQDFAEEQRTDHSYMIRSVKNLVQEHKVSHNQTLASLKDATEDQKIGHNYIAKSIRDVVRNQEHSRDSAEAAERAKIIDWFSPINFFLRQADISNTRQRGTGEWLLENRLFNHWKSRTGSTMWCRGMPGAGKTVLASIVVDNLRATLESRSMRAAVIYLNYKETEAQSPSNLLAGLWRQLVFDRPISQAVHQLYAKHREQRTRPSLEEVDAILCSTISELSKVFIVVDALDEYPEQQRSILLGHLSSLTTGSTVSLMLTSRPHININYVAEILQILEIRATEEDIRRYIDAAVLKSSRLSKHIENNSSLREEIEEIIVRRSDGMFLLAKLQVDSLMTKHTVKAVRNALRNMPDNLNSSYDEIVDRINRQSEDDKALAWRTLSWITNAKRPLRPSELREALAVEEGSKKLDSDNLLDIDTILSVCASLVVINEADRRLRLIHFTAQNYLEQVQSTIFPHAATEITATCITYLSFDIFSRNEDDAIPLFYQNPFFNYAVEYCLIHARGPPEVRIKQLILAFLADCQPWWQLWKFRIWSDRPKSNAMSKLWIASLFHLKEICRDLIQEDGQIDEAARDGLTDILGLLIYHDGNVNTKRADGIVLDLASGYHYDVVKLLIEHGADVNAQCGSILQAACSFGHEDIVKLLIEHGADVNAQGGEYGSTLQLASRAGHKDIVKLLIEHRADLNAQSEEYGSVLQDASGAGRGDVVCMLIEHGADVNVQGGHYGSALQLASGAGHKDIVKVLIEHGADVNAQGGEYGSALQLASGAGHKDIVKVLIEHRADLNAQSEEYGSTLQLASRAGHKDIVKVLIEHGADVNAQGEGEYGRSALQLASGAGHKDVVGVLIEHGADVNAQGEGEYGRSALQLASGAGHKDVVGVLIEHGADVNAQGEGEYGRSALQLASGAGHKDIVSVLIEHGADVNVQGGGEYGRSALQVASGAGHKDIVSVLIEHGADVNAQGGGESGRSALQLASGAGHKDVVGVLIEHGADVNAQCGWYYGSALQAASKEGLKDIVCVLIEHGADVNAQGGKYGSALQAASVAGNEDIVCVLIEHGADVNAQGGYYGSALQAAWRSYHEDTVCVLIEHGADLKDVGPR